MRNKTLWAVGAAVVLIALLCVLIVRGRSPAQHSTTLQVAPPTTAVAPADRIKVGVIVSEYTATGPHWTREEYGHHAPSTAWALRDPAIEIFPIVEPGTEASGEIPGILSKSFAGKKPLNASSRDELKKLDVIVTGRAWNTPQEVLDAVEGAVSDGVGLLDWGSLGIVTPGHGEQVDRINGFCEGQYGLGRRATECAVVADHPILGRLKKGGVVMLTANGEYGVLRAGGVGLLHIADTGSYVPIGEGTQRDRDDFQFFPVYVTTLGKGRVVGWCFPSWGAVPKQLDQAVGGKFMVRCVKWLAKRPLD